MSTLRVLFIALMVSAFSATISILFTTRQVQKTIGDAETKRNEVMLSSFSLIFTDALNLAGYIGSLRDAAVRLNQTAAIDQPLDPLWALGAQTVTTTTSYTVLITNGTFAAAVAVTVPTMEDIPTYVRSRNYSAASVVKPGVYLDVLIGPSIPKGLKMPFFDENTFDPIQNITDGEFMIFGIGSSRLPFITSVMAIGVGPGRAILGLFDQASMWKVAKQYWNEELTMVKLCAKNNTGGWVEPCAGGDAVVSNAANSVWVDRVEERPLNWTVVGILQKVKNAELTIAVSAVRLSISLTVGMTVLFVVFAGILAHRAQRRAAQTHGSLEEQERFMALTSHDMILPINIISKASYRGKKAHSMGEIHDILQSIRPAATVLAYGMQNLMDANVAEIDLSLSVCDLRKVVLGAMNLVRVTAEVSPAVQVTVDVPEQVPLVLADGQRIRRCVMHLLTNAFKSTQKGHIRLALDVHMEGTRQVGAIVRVEDTGSGIPLSVLKSLSSSSTSATESKFFQRTFRKWQRKQRKGEGAGGVATATNGVDHPIPDPRPMSTNNNNSAHRNPRDVYRVQFDMSPTATPPTLKGQDGSNRGWITPSSTKSQDSSALWDRLRLDSGGSAHHADNFHSNNGSSDYPFVRKATIARIDENSAEYKEEMDERERYNEASSPASTSERRHSLTQENNLHRYRMSSNGSDVLSLGGGSVNGNGNNNNYNGNNSLEGSSNRSRRNHRRGANRSGSLVIVKSILEAMGSQLELSLRPGPGTEALFHLHGLELATARGASMENLSGPVSPTMRTQPVWLKRQDSLATIVSSMTHAAQRRY